MGFRKWPN